ncbi:dihydrofolate reductase family protein [Microbacterium sediminis]|uniref:Deaminase n=1 Tax=Microbacterium sediminis TaxID=904291 RepID=A0A1B9NFZ3_9MICO|nr:dihydrofolate reductase family protein [Microbacterium sediminis]OCG75525.1 deaminase [Microbacterium sediminis]QBR73920.1 dihydrofolate reductase [Microbacterium sediminis]
MLLVSMGVSVDGFIADRTGSFDWGAPDDELFGFHLARVRELGAVILGRRLYETMRVWETDPAMRGNAAESEFADVWTALPKVVFSRTLDRVEGNARLATGSVSDEVARTLAETDREVEIGGAMLAGQAIEAGLVDEFRIFRYPVIVGGGAPLLPHIADPIALDLIESRVFSGRVVYERYRRAA